jgi:putative ABC transport system ATP-binding protein
MNRNETADFADVHRFASAQSAESVVSKIAAGVNGMAISARGLVKRYQSGRIVALGGLDLDVQIGEFVAICGPSGCGKSTLLNLIAAIDRPDSGELTVLDHRLAGLSSSQADEFRGAAIGLVFQLHNLLPQLSAAENVQVAMLPRKLSPADRARRAADLLDRVGLSARMKSLPPTLSGGERQRVAIARALANQPRLLLADEPTGALDSHTGHEIIDLLTEIQRERGMTLVVVTHEEQVAARAGRIVRVLDGRVSAD